MNKKNLILYCGLTLYLALALYAGLALKHTSLQIPLVYYGDGVFFSIFTKALGDDPFVFTFHKLGAPFQLDFIDFAFAQFVDFFIIKVFRTLGLSFGMSINLFWLFNIVASGLFCAWTFSKAGVKTWPLFILSAAFALLPWAFLRNTSHLAYHLTYIPIVCYWIYALAVQQESQLSKKEKFFILFMLFLLGLNNTYYAFFALVVLAMAYLYRRSQFQHQWKLFAASFMALCGGTFLSLLPSMIYWSKYGKGFATSFKYVAESDIYGLKLRHLLQPIPNHKIPFLSSIDAQLMRQQFPLENENLSVRLGLLGSVALLLVLAYAFGFWKNKNKELDTQLKALSALTLFICFVAFIGGFGSLFNAFVSPQIRCYNRMGVMIAYFALLFLGLLWSKYYDSINPKKNVLSGLFLLLFIPIDQIPTRLFKDFYETSKSQFFEEQGFVQQIENGHKSEQMIFQLPYAEFFGDGQDLNKMRDYDSARLYLHSRAARWSWGAVSQRDRGWFKNTSRLPAEILKEKIIFAGFTGLSIDTFGYKTDEKINEIKKVFGEPSFLSSNGRYLYFDLTEEGEKARKSLTPMEWEQKQQEALIPPPGE